MNHWFGGNPALNRGPSRLHLSDRFTFSGIYELPVGKGRRFGGDMPAAANAIVGGWDISSIIVLRTGNALTASTSGNIANADRITQVPHLLGDPNLARGDRGWDSSFFRTGSDVWATPAQYTLRSAGVRPLYGPGNRRWDFSIHKTHKFSEEGMELQIRAEFFNFTNHPNMGNPGTRLGSASFGQVNSTWTLDNPREAQFGIKFKF